ncbi:transposon-transfer assisting family protein [Christensenellaceae bacterium OttesenSCG-928-M15]|nr:transposon-transfer assisting family protein [Christensenellaceae bacterium OttesenSCG-928-M15]
MNGFTVEEINLMSIYHTGTRRELIAEMTAALPDMDTDFQELTRRVVDRLEEVSDSEFSQFALDPADEQDG